MPKVSTITVHVKCKNKGGFSISIDDWEEHVKKSESGEIEWELKSAVENGNNTARVKWMRIENPFSGTDWPFVAEPPDKTYIAKPGANAKSGPVKPGWPVSASPPPARYGLTICFGDDSGGPDRYAYIDPDMVIDI